jgi:hypothetical protein
MRAVFLANLTGPLEPLPQPSSPPLRLLVVVPAEIKSGSPEDRVLRLLAERYPITLKQVTLMLRLRPDVARLTVKRLENRGLVVVEALPNGDTFLTLSGAGFRVIGLTPPDAARARKSGKLPPAKPRDEDDPAFM